MGEKSIWISGTENIKENGKSLVSNPPVEENGKSLGLDDPPIEENKIEPYSERSKRPNSEIIVTPPSNSGTSLDDTTIPSDEYSRIDTEVCTYSPESPKIPNPNSNID